MRYSRTQSVCLLDGRASSLILWLTFFSDGFDLVLWEKPQIFQSKDKQMGT